jgi:mannose/fructose/N-acetylgalactosamine-specific phosphotransferase system component IIC
LVEIKKNRGTGVMLAMIVGFVLALIFVGLPLGIIGLFVASILDQRSHEAEDPSQNAPTSETQSGDQDQRGYHREIIGLSGSPPTSWR